MTLINIAVFVVGAILYSLILPRQWRGWALLAGSVVAIYWLQPAIPVYPVDFILPTATLVLGVAGWLMTRAETERTIDRDSRFALGMMVIIVVALAVVGGLLSVTPSEPPDALNVLIPLVGIAVLIATFAALIPDRKLALTVFILLIIAIFAVLKAPPLTEAFSAWLRARTGRPLHLANVGDVQWLGFSYVAFRVIHTLRDRQSNKLPPLTLREYVTYLIFFPAFTAGPIDRAERFVKDYRALLTQAENDIRRTPSRIVEGGTRIVVGICKKFVIADSLVRFALSPALATQATTAGSMWILVYAYAFRIYFDFAGYSDIAIGIARLFGINLPENFDRPYLKDNLTAFWQSWHMTLSTWARTYVFTPLSRALMMRPRKPSTTVTVLVCQVATMVVIGLWHGMTLNFVIWGLYHGLGLWIHKLYTDRTRTFYQGLSERPRRILSWASTLLTFHFVVLGWVFFALPDMGTSLLVLRKLFGG